MKVLLIGSNGLLGQNLSRLVPENWNLSCASLEPRPFNPRVEKYSVVDLRNRNEILSLIERERPDWILNSAAMTNVDLCEREKAACRMINRDAVGWMAGAGVPMVHFSTDYVFNGKHGPYREDHPVQPLGYYGQTKLESEKLVLDACAKSLVIRTMTLWGNGIELRPSFVDFIKTGLSKKKTINIVTDQMGNPTLAVDLARAVWALIKGGFSGVFHVSGSELLSRYDWALKIADFFNLQTETMLPCTTQALNQAARRPLKSGFILDKFIEATGITPLNVKQQLQAVHGVG